jgi:multimeric flavodoxin WrbA
MDVKILGVVGSPRKGGNTEVMIRAALEAAEKSGDVLTEIVLLAGRKVHPCISCYHCFFHEGECSIKDDANDILNKMMDADGLIIGSPVYFGSLTATLKSLFERCMRLNVLKDSPDSMKYEDIKNMEVQFPLRNKVGGALSVGGVQSGGQERVLMDIQGFLLMNDMIVVSDGGIRTPEVHPHFGGVGIARGKKKILEDHYGMETSKSLGMRIAEVTKIVKRGLSSCH